MIVYFDTSALVKLLVGEPYSDHVRSVFLSAGRAVTHRIAWAELMAGLGKARNLARLDEARLRDAVRDAERVWAGLDVVEVDPLMVRRAGELALMHGLRGYDAVHLAAAEAVAHAAGQGVTVAFLAFDRALNEAGRELGLRPPPLPQG
ncbi:MAG TPA: PIN domain-containing protein [Chromatiales bacterium]|nr:PIN domain-containing protein [Chromatiales bacterium]